MLTINSYEEFEKYLGQELGKSEWLEVDQDRINAFADATLDHQWIHVDTEKAKEGPFGQTIVHGYLTLSLLPYMWEQIIKVNNLKMMVTALPTFVASAKLKSSSPSKSRIKRSLPLQVLLHSCITSTNFY